MNKIIVQAICNLVVAPKLSKANNKSCHSKVSYFVTKTMHGNVDFRSRDYRCVNGGLVFYLSKVGDTDKDNDDEVNDFVGRVVRMA